MKFSNKKIVNQRKKYVIQFSVGIVLIILAILFLIGYIVGARSDKANAKDLEEVMGIGEYAIGDYTYIDVSEVYYSFASYSNSSNAFYYVSDDRYLYIAYLSKSTYEELKKKDLSYKPYRLYGTAKAVTEDLLKIGVDDWNTDLEEGESPITSSEYLRRVGNMYLDSTDKSSSSSTFMLALFVANAIAGGIFFALGLTGKKNFDNKVNSINDSEVMLIENEMDNPESILYKNNKLILTNNYLISFNQAFCVTKYTDILWIYPKNFYYNGFRASSTLNIFNKDGKIYELSCQNRDNVRNDVWQIVISKNPDVKTGYTTENIKFSNDYRKCIK